MATSSKHDHKNVGCHRIRLQLRSGDRVLANDPNTRRNRQVTAKKSPGQSGPGRPGSGPAPIQAPASRRPPNRNRYPAERHANARDRNDPESPATLTGPAPPSSGPPARGLRATSIQREACKPRHSARPSRNIARRKPRKVSATNHVPPTSDFRTGSRCALVFRDFPLIGRTTRRNSASPTRTHLVAADAFRY